MRRAGLYALLAACALVTITPFVVTLSTSLTPHTFVLELPPKIWPQRPTLDNYTNAASANGFVRYFVNSLVVAVTHVAGVLLLGSMMAYAFARFEFPGKRLVFYALMATLMIPGLMLLLPQFVLARDLGLVDHRAGLVLFYVASQLAFVTFLLRGFFQTIPRELEEAMTIDGAGPWRIYWQLMLPLSKPALATAGIFAFLFSWDEFPWALSIINNPDLRMLPVAIAQFQGAHTTDWGIVFAASVIAVTPVLVVYVVFQRYLVSGLQAGALKG